MSILKNKLLSILTFSDLIFKKLAVLPIDNKSVMLKIEIKNMQVLEKTIMFTKREIEVLDLLVLGYNNSEISDKLSITNHTTKAHLASIYAKLNVNNRVQASVRYLQLLPKEKLPDIQ